MKRHSFLSVILGLLSLQLLAPYARGQEIDCFDPKSVGETAVCGSHLLHDLDRELVAGATGLAGRTAIFEKCAALAEPQLRAADYWSRGRCLVEAYNTALNKPVPEKGNPYGVLHPVCIESLLPLMENPDATPGTRIDLQECMIGSGHLPIELVDVPAGKFWHYERWSPDMRLGFIGYREIGRIDDDVLVELVDNGGGTGTFTMIARLGGLPGPDVAIGEGQSLTLNYLWFFGDRCNGGLKSAELRQDGRINASVHVTTSDLLWSSPSAIDGSWTVPDGISFSAPACIGSVHYEIDPKKPDAEFRLAGITIDRIEDSEWALEAFPLQACVNQQLVTVLPGGKVPAKLSEAQLENLGKAVRANCN